MNKFIFTGNLGRDAEVKATAGGTTVCTFSVAVSSGYGDRKESHWINCALFGKRAESRLVEYLVSGQKVLISGELKTREYQKRDGTNGFSVEVSVDDIDLIGERKKQDEEPGFNMQPMQPMQPMQQPRPAAPADDYTDDIPF